jgi:predicted transcriptional regulator
MKINNVRNKVKGIRLIQKSVMLLVEIAERRGRWDEVGKVAKKQEESI